MKTKFFYVLAIAISSIFFVACTDDDEPTKAEGQLNVKMTDAPSDDANIQGTFVTVSSLKVDGKTVDGFEKQTIDISAYQEGKTKLIFSDMVEAKSYSSIALELDYESDASGNAPGCYVLTSDNAKHNLAASSSTNSELTFNKNVDVQSAGSSDIVFDFDLRKSIKRNEQSAETKYSFVTNAELQSAVRIVNEDETGEIEGKVTASTTSDHEYIVYAYKKGEYNSTTESQAQGSGNVMFANAETSAKIKADGSYKLSFLEDGDYEIHVAAYSRSETDGKLTYTGIASAVSLIGELTLNNVQVSSKSSVELDISITAVI